ncbi:MAG: dihydroorotate dehydrogenase [Methanomassiliicoccus sp.]|nr:dihydroorotate dehydrogenase [Methanomassiliicoccus sp.]
MTTLEVDLAGIKLRNPTILASGVMGETGESLLKVAEAGAGGLVTKSIGLEPRKGYPNPTLVELPDGYINAMGLPGPGIEAFAEEMEVALRSRVPIIGSLFAAIPEDFTTLAGKMEDYGAAAVELNLSCPHAKGYGMEVGIDPDAVRSIVSSVKGAVGIPVMAKLTPNTHRLVEVARAVEAAGGDAIVAVNTVKAMAISVEARRPILYNRTGGLSGPAIKGVGLRCVYELHEAVALPIVGVGGIERSGDVLEYMMAGASAVQVGSAVGRKGLAVFREITDGLMSYMGAHDLGDLREIVGVAHAH